MVLVGGGDATLSAAPAGKPTVYEGAARIGTLAALAKRAGAGPGGVGSGAGVGGSGSIGGMTMIPSYPETPWPHRPTVEACSRLKSSRTTSAGTSRTG